MEVATATQISPVFYLGRTLLGLNYQVQFPVLSGGTVEVENISEKAKESERDLGHNNVWNLFKIDNKDTKIMSLTSFCCLYY